MWKRFKQRSLLHCLTKYEEIYTYNLIKETKNKGKNWTLGTISLISMNLKYDNRKQRSKYFS